MTDYRMNAKAGALSSNLLKPTLPKKQIKVHRENESIIVELDGKFLKMPYDAASQVGKIMVNLAQTIHAEKQIVQGIINQ